MKDSEHQINIYDVIISRSSKNLAVKATAGSGKTTTLIKSVSMLPRRENPLLISFSNSIVDELKKRAPEFCDVRTLHSIGFQTLNNNIKSRITLNKGKYFSMAIQYINAVDKDMKKGERFHLASQLDRLFNLMRLSAIENDPEKIEWLVYQHDLEVSPKHYEILTQMFKSSHSMDGNCIDYTDMLYLPKYLDLRIINRPFVALDESQDCSPIQHKLITRITGNSGRLFSVGDPYQAIYGFAGADSDSYSKFSNQENTVELPLLICYRCPQKIVLEAQQVNPEITPYELQKDGDVNSERHISSIREGDLVLCRNTLPLVDVFYKLIGRGMKAKIVGKDFENQLFQIAEIVSIALSNKDAYLLLDNKLERFRKDLSDNGVENPYTHYKYVSFLEKVNIVKTMLRFLGEPFRLKNHIQDVFDEKKLGVTLMTIHRSKGLEAENVFVIKTFDSKDLIPSRYATQGWQKEQERNLDFVARTRAKNSLTYLTLKTTE